MSRTPILRPLPVYTHDGQCDRGKRLADEFTKFRIDMGITAGTERERQALADFVARELALTVSTTQARDRKRWRRA